MRNHKQWMVAFLLSAALIAPAVHAADGETCWGGDKSAAKLEFKVRKEDAFRTTTELLSKMMIALDRVLLSKGKGDPDFHENLDFVMGLQLDPEKMNIVIESS